MKETPVSNLEKAFILASLEDKKRIDGRLLNERRELSIDFGKEDGCCVCNLGRTRVLAQASCSIVEPRPTRPNEGLLIINVNFTPMCAPRFVDRPSGPGNPVDEEITEVSRLLERLLKESRCLDMESLCISAEEKVWEIRLDINVLNHEGNVADCAGVAGLAALAHFKRPDVTLEENVVTVHPTSERDPIPLALHHFPICSTFAFFKPTNNQSSSSISSNTPTFHENGEKLDAPAKKCDRIVVCDPNHTEEAIMDGKLVLGMNPYKEICTLHLAGKMIIDKNFVMYLANTAANMAKDTVDLVKNALARDDIARKETAASKERSGYAPDIGLAATLKKGSILQSSKTDTNIDLANRLIESEGKDLDAHFYKTIDENLTSNIVQLPNETEEKESSETSTEESDTNSTSSSESSEEEEGEEEIQAVKAVSAEEKRKERILAEIEVDDDSEEELTTTVRTKDLSAPIPD